MLDLYKFKQRIKERCAQTGVSQSFLCEKVGRQRTYLNNIWRGATTPSDNDLKQFAELLSTTPAYLRGETDDPETRVSQVIWPDKIQKSPAKLAMANKLLEMSEGDAQIYVGLYNMDIESINSIRQLLDAFKRQNGERP